MKELLETFVVENQDLERLESKLSEFNLFETLGLQYYEIRHSNTLGYLFAPSETHGLGDYFLKRFLIHTLAENDASSVSPVEVDSWNLSDTVVKREYKDIDVLIMSPRNSFVCCIENKVLASEAQHQLAKYHSIVNREFNDFKFKVFIFLSPLGVEPSDSANWLVATYEIVARILQTIVNLKIANLGMAQATFIKHYATIIGRHLLDNSDEKQLARQIYNAHKQAIDYIIENMGDSRQEVFDAVKAYCAVPTSSLILLHSTVSRMRFTTKRIDLELPHEGNGKWVGIQHMFVFELSNNTDSISLALIMGPGDQVVRQKYLDSLKPKFLAKYLPYKASLSEMYNTIFKKTFVAKDESSALDSAGKVDRVLKYLGTINGGELADVEDALLGSLK